MKGYALDTNIVSYALKGSEKILEKIDEVRNGKRSLVIPPMVYYEVRRWLLITESAAKKRAFEAIYAHSGIDVIDKRLLDRAASLHAGLRKKGITIGDADILIAVFCMAHDYTLVTNNSKHFEDIENLNMVNWLD
ncbi:MAG: PIN domain-containing protein [Spirochaetaceae bacterium]|jgi:tRNA(fMet)-specific endonuclease VapC|nr:PIN domain-containing protein [Spirochaetaceae bacterium]